ncbi:MAG: non-hydrolyzing UDP-N-acetylglucosamine 2-epimerase [Chakrabartia sp.]
MAPVVQALRATPGLDVIVCSTGQHADLVNPVLRLFDIQPDHHLAVMQPGQSLEDLLARLVSHLGALMAQVQPARVLVQGDTLTTLGGALAAHFHRIPVGHIEAGLRSGDLLHPWPEEMCRKAVTAIADVHFAPTPRAADALRAENVPDSEIHITGNTGIDALVQARAYVQRQPDCAAASQKLLQRHPHKKIILVTAHRRENWGEGLRGIAQAVARLADRPDAAVICALHPNPQIRAAFDPLARECPQITLAPPLGYAEFVHLLDQSSVVLTDSGGVQEEAPAFGKPVLVLRKTTERPEGLAAGTAHLVGTDPDLIVDHAQALLDDPVAYARMAQAHNPYGDGQAATRIARLLADAA